MQQHAQRAGLVGVPPAWCGMTRSSRLTRALQPSIFGELLGEEDQLLAFFVGEIKSPGNGATVGDRGRLLIALPVSGKGERDANAVSEGLETPAERLPPCPDELAGGCLLYTSPSPRDSSPSRMPSSA